MKFVHIADVHLGMSFKSASFSQSFGNKKREAIKKNLKQVIHYIKEHQIDLLLIAGDFLEGDYVELRDLLDVKYLFDLIPNTSIVIMAGNHDPIAVETNPYKLIQWPKHVMIIGDKYEFVDLDQINTSVISVSWKSKGPHTFNKSLLEEQIYQSTHANKIVMLHGDVYAKNDYFSMDVHELANLKANYVALGHIHKPDVIMDKIVYPGSLEPLDFSENYNHGFVIGDISQGKLTIKRMNSMVLPMKVLHIDITGCESMLEILDLTKDGIDKMINHESLSNLMIRIQLVGEKNLYIGDINKEYIQSLNEFIGSDLVYIEIKDKTRQGYDIDLLYKEHEHDIIGHFIRSLRTKDLNNEVNKKALSTGITLLLEAMR